MLPKYIFVISVLTALPETVLTHSHRNSRASSSDGDDSLMDPDDYLEAVKIDIEGAFNTRGSFACPLVKPVLHTGDNISNLSPEDIDIVAAMGDSLATGRGLWPSTDVEFRGAAFPIGGDANIDGLVTIPNILSQFNTKLEGTAHGMGDREQLPAYQYNVAQSNSETEHLPEQAVELVFRMRKYTKRLNEKWTLIIIATGSEEFCYHCDAPSHSSIRQALGILRKGIPKAFVVLLGPTHVALSFSLNRNLLKPRCPCLADLSKSQYLKIAAEWKRVFVSVQDEFNSLNYSTFGVLAIPHLTIHSRDPHSLFVEDKPLLNRKGHMYAAKWLWNRMISGTSYNISDAVFSQDSYYCPSVGCPYFRSVHNFKYCSIQTENEYQIRHASTIPPNMTTPKPHRVAVREHQWHIVAVVIVLAFLSVTTFGTIFFCRSRDAKISGLENMDPHSSEATPLPDARLGG
ncbi:unnamed protein product [Auanema sp. JU1783]|nr:unnamed protein product [Auanema sp. JU1783]